MNPPTPKSPCFPSPLQLLAAKRGGATVTIGLPDGRQILLSEYLRSWRKLKSLPPQTSVANWDWFPLTAGEILHKLSRGVHDRINRHLPWFNAMYRYHADHPPHDRHLRAKLDALVGRGLLVCDCRWCGSPLSSYHSINHRFCDAGCRRDYNL